MKITIRPNPIVIGAIFGVLLVLVAIQLVLTTTSAPVWPAPAFYDAHATQVQGQRTLSTGVEIAPPSQTLDLTVAGARIESIVFTDVDVGATGVTDGIQITGDGVGPTYIECENVTLDGIIAPTLSLADSEIYNLVLTDNTVDGLSVSPVLDATVLDITFGSLRGALNIPGVTGSTFDRIIIDTDTTAASCKDITFTNVRSVVSAVTLSNIKAGTLTIKNSLIGDGTGLASASFVVAATVKIQQSTITNNVEQPVSVQ